MTDSLVVEIHYTNHLEVNAFTAFLEAFNSLYEGFLKIHYPSKNIKKKLCMVKVGNGSAVIELLKVQDNAECLSDFFLHLDKMIDYL